MNMIDIQDKLKGLSEQQLVGEMQSPSGAAPQFLVLSEITRRKRMRDSFQNQQAQPTTTIAEEAVASAGVPGGGIAEMARSLAPNSSMAQNTAAMPQQAMPQEQPVQGMYAGGYVQKMAGGGQPPNMSNPMVSAWVQREAQRRGVSVEEVLSSLGPTGEAIARQPQIKADRNRMLGLEPEGEGMGLGSIGSPVNLPTQTDLDQRYADDQRGDTFRMPPQSDLDRRFLEDQFGINSRPMTPQPIDTLPDIFASEPRVGRVIGREPPAFPTPQTPQMGQFSAPEMEPPVDLDLTQGGYPPPQRQPARQAQFEPPIYPDMPEVPKDPGPSPLDRQGNLLFLQDEIKASRMGPMTELDKTNPILDLPPAPDRSGVMGTNQTRSFGPSSLDKFPDLAATEIRIGPDGSLELVPPAPTPLPSGAFDRSGPATQGNVPPADDKPNVPPSADQTKGGGITTDNPDVPASPDPATSVTGRGSGAAVGGSNVPTSYEQELRDAMVRAEKRANQDKWMALAQVGMQLMASKEPTLGGALGEAGIAGLQSFQQSRDGYEAERLGLSKSLYDLQQQQAAALAAQRAAGAKATRGPNGIKDIMAIADQYDKAIKSMMVDDGLGGLAMPTDEQSVARIAELRREKDKYIGMMIPESTFDATAQ